MSPWSPKAYQVLAILENPTNYACGNLPGFLTPRDKEPSLSSSEEKSSDFGWLERKLMRKQEYI